MLKTIIFTLLMSIFTYQVTPEEFDELCQIVEAEATDGTEEQKMNVASCILSRVESDEWPDNIHDVIFQPGQFSPATIDGRYYKVKIQDSTKKAVLKVLIKGKTINATYFCTPTCQSARNGFHSRLNYICNDGMHNYYK